MMYFKISSGVQALPQDTLAGGNGLIVRQFAHYIRKGNEQGCPTGDGPGLW